MHKSVRKITGSESGTATVEAAVCLPLLLVLVFGSIESSNAIFLKQSMTVAAYESAKVASAPQGTIANAAIRCQEVMDVRDVPNYTMSVSPSSLDADTASGTTVTVTVQVNGDAASMGPLWFFTGKTLSKSVSMVRL